ncbi:hypothetical protein C5C07_19570 [Haloferax sp. Atlit-4N]|nr:hypothetical protein C5C07_19570 [Haloferax sp. Atlit-4N]
MKGDIKWTPTSIVDTLVAIAVLLVLRAIDFIVQLSFGYSSALNSVSLFGLTLAVIDVLSAITGGHIGKSNRSYFRQ